MAPHFKCKKARERKKHTCTSNRVNNKKRRIRKSNNLKRVMKLNNNKKGLYENISLFRYLEFTFGHCFYLFQFECIIKINYLYKFIEHVYCLCADKINRKV